MRLGQIYKPTGEPVVDVFFKTLVAGEPAVASHIYGIVQAQKSHCADFLAGMADTHHAGPGGKQMFTLQYILAETDPAFYPDEMAVNIAELPRVAKGRQAKLWQSFAYFSVAEAGAIEKYKAMYLRRFLDMYDSPEYDFRGRMQTKLDARRIMSAAANMITPHTTRFLPYTDLFDKFYLHRRLFATDTGYMGAGPWTVRQGDVVMLVAGAATPYIFRPSRENPGSWQLIGEAYCHAVMNGELTRGYSNLDWQEITVI